MVAWRHTEKHYFCMCSSVNIAHINQNWSAFIVPGIFIFPPNNTAVPYIYLGATVLFIDGCIFINSSIVKMFRYWQMVQWWLWWVLASTLYLHCKLAALIVTTHIVVFHVPLLPLSLPIYISKTTEPQLLPWPLLTFGGFSCWGEYSIKLSKEAYTHQHKRLKIRYFLYH